MVFRRMYFHKLVFNDRHCVVSKPQKYKQLNFSNDIKKIFFNSIRIFIPEVLWLNPRLIVHLISTQQIHTYELTNCKQKKRITSTFFFFFYRRRWPYTYNFYLSPARKRRLHSEIIGTCHDYELESFNFLSTVFNNVNVTLSFLISKSHSLLSVPPGPRDQ